MTCSGDFHDACASAAPLIWRDREPARSPQVPCQHNVTDFVVEPQIEFGQ
jgi:hypothetical protein